MAYLKCAMNRKNASGTYDVLSPRTQSEVVFRPSGRTVEQDLAAYLPSVQGSDVVPNSLTKGKLLVGSNKVWFGNSDGDAIKLATESYYLDFGLPYFTGWNLGYNIQDDSTMSWVDLGTCYTYVLFNDPNSKLVVEAITGSWPRTGIVLSIVTGSDIFQLMNVQGNDCPIILTRAGNQDGWWYPWTKLSIS